MAWHGAGGRGDEGADRLFPAEFQRRLAADRLGIEADVLPGGHLIALANPAGLAGYLMGA